MANERLPERSILIAMTRWLAGMTGLAGATETHERDGKHSSRIGVRDVLSYEDWRRSCLPPPLWIPAFAGMTNGGPEYLCWM